MSDMTRRLVPVFLILILAVPPCSSDEYSRILKETVARIELGQYDEAASSVERVLVWDDSDVLGRSALAVIYLHVGRLDEAEREFNQVLAAEPDNWQAHYALGLICVLRKRTADAEKHFAYARKFAGAREDMSALDQYLAFVKGGLRDPDALLEAQTPLLARETSAMAALGSGRREEAVALLSELLRAPARSGFEETRAPLVTFVAAQPIALPGGTLTWKPGQRKCTPIVSGQVALKADASRAAGVRFVTFYIDDVFVGVTNYEPFEFQWNTASHWNGLHHIRIEAKNEAGAVLSSKSVWVNISNPTKSGVRSRPGVDELAQRLWRCIRVTESRKLAHYELGKLCLESGDRRSAIGHFEYAVAYQPSFRDARELLNGLLGRRSECVQLRRGSPGSKMIALTFDDGPNECTVETLDVLDRLRIPATFFLVGFRAEAQPELVKAIQAGGHQVENHTYTHPNLTTLSSEQAGAELAKCAAVISAITGKSPAYFRPPGGHSNETTRRAAAAQGLTEVFWTIICSPYEGSRYRWLAEHVITNAADGAIVLMHNGEPAATAAMPMIAEELRKQGYRFVTISELVSAGIDAQ